MAINQHPVQLNLKYICQSKLKSLFWSTYISSSFFIGFVFLLNRADQYSQDFNMVLIMAILLFITLFLILRFGFNAKNEVVTQLTREQVLDRKRKLYKRLALFQLLLIPYSLITGIALLSSVMLAVYFFLAYLFFDSKFAQKFWLVGLVLTLVINLVVYEDIRSTFFSITFLGGLGPFALSIFIFGLYLVKSKAYFNKNASHEAE